MPGYRGHILAGSLFYFLIVWAFKLTTKTPALLITWFICTLAGALFPDIDTKSKGQKIFYFLFAIFVASSIFTKQYSLGAWASLVSFTPLLTNHRGLFHSTLFLAVLIFSLTYSLTILFPVYKAIIIPCAVFFALGVATHLLFDFRLKINKFNF